LKGAVSHGMIRYRSRRAEHRNRQVFYRSRTVLLRSYQVPVNTGCLWYATNDASEKSASRYIKNAVFSSPRCRLLAVPAHKKIDWFKTDLSAFVCWCTSRYGWTPSHTNSAPF
jgi:hypothetical protein